MTRKIPNSPVIVLAALLLFVSVVKADDAPPLWLQEAARLTPPAYDIKNVPAVVLRNDEIITIDTSGKITTIFRYAVRILVREGREEAVAREVYNTDHERIREMNAWLIRRTGPIKYYGKKEVVDVASASNDLYNEARFKYISAEDDAAESDVFGYEAVKEESGIFSQLTFRFQHDLPVLFSQFSLTLPAGWRAESVTFNRAKVEPTLNGSTYLWELRDLAPISHEAGSPRRSSLAPRLAVSFFPAQTNAAHIKTFTNWTDVARWMSEVEDPQMTVDDAIAAKVHDLVANAKTEFERIQAIARYVQQIQYISIQVGTGRGGGYRPHLATEVFAKSYGDCKDKANLMRAMLSVLKIQAFMVSITADDPLFVRAEWASPHQFNHCIIAVKVSDAVQSPAVITDPVLGRLLIFDATDPYTRLGDIPEDEQGSLALISHKDASGLFVMPTMPAETNRLERNVEITLGQSGEIAGKVSERSFGQSAVSERAMLRGLSAADYNRSIETWISRGASGAKATKIATSDNSSDGNFHLDVDFNANSYAQIMQGKLMVFKPAVIGRLEKLSFTEGKRMHPYMMDAKAYSETVKVKLPLGFAVDEMPEPTKIETAFGQYSAAYEVKGDTLIFARSLKLNRSTVPADKYNTIMAFFGSVRSAEQSPVVLVKK